MNDEKISETLTNAIMKCSVCHDSVDRMRDLKNVIMRVKDKDSGKPLFLGLGILCPKCKTKYANKKEHLVIFESIEFTMPKDLKKNTRKNFLDMVTKLWEEYDAGKDDIEQRQPKLEI